MAYEEGVITITVLAASDLSAAQYKGMTLGSAGTVTLIASLGARCSGILQDKPSAAGRAGSMGISGVSKVVAGAAIVAGTELTIDATGRAITTSAADQHIIGEAMEAAAAAGNIIAVRLKSYQRSA